MISDLCWNTAEAACAAHCRHAHWNVWQGHAASSWIAIFLSVTCCSLLLRHRAASFSAQGVKIKAAKSRQTITSLSPLAFQTGNICRLPTQANVTTALIVNDYLICTAFDRLNHHVCWHTLKYSSVQALYIHGNSLQQGNAANVTAGKIWNVLNMNNICISAVRASQDSDSKLFCPWLRRYLPAARLRRFDVRTLPPADSLVTRYQGRRGTKTRATWSL